MKIHSLTKFAPALLAAGILPVTAEEGGSGHYLPGSMSSFVDGVPAAETFIARLNLLSYEGSYDRGRPLPIAGVTALGVDADSFASGISLLWRPAWEPGGNWSFAVSATIPWVWMDVSADVGVTLPGGNPGTIRRKDSVDDIGDIVVMPLMLNYKFSDDFNANFRVGVYAPTGSYEVGRLANTGKNFWTVEPTLGLMYFGQKNGIEASLFTGFDFNTENDDTDYESGTQFHLDGTLAQHFPLGKGLAGVGLGGYYYEQITGDSGAGAKFGAFEGLTAGLGPVLSWAGKWGDTDVIAELKWLHELETEKRLEGDYIWGKLVFKF